MTVIKSEMITIKVAVLEVKAMLVEMKIKNETWTGSFIDSIKENRT